METENVRRELKISQNIWKMLSCIENANINIQSKLHVPFYGHLFKSCTKNPNRFFRKQIQRKIPVFLNFSFVFYGAFENYWKNFTFDNQSTNQIHFPIRKNTVEEYPSIFTVLKGDDRHKNEKNKKIKK